VTLMATRKANAAPAPRTFEEIEVYMPREA
jgi:hypothetical protein